MRIEHATRGLHQQGVALHGNLLAVGFPRQRQQIGNTAHQFRIADAREEAGSRRLARGVFLEAERRAPDLHRMHARGLGAFGAEDHHAPIFQPRITVADDGRGKLAFDQVVGEQRAASIDGFIEDVKHILAVGRTDRTLEAHPFYRRIELARFPVLQQIAARPDDAVILRQLDASQADCIDALHLLRERVVGQIPPLFLAVRQHAQQDQATDLGELDLRIIQRLRLVLHGLAVDAKAVLGVVLDLDGEIATDGFDEHGIEDVDVRMAAIDNHFSRGRLPFEIKWCRESNVALATVVDVANVLAIGRNAPAEHANIGEPLADLEARQKLSITHHQLQQARVLVVGIQLAEILHEAVDGEEGAGVAFRLHVVAFGGFHQLVEAEHILDAGFLLQPDEDVVAEQQQITDLHDVPRHAVVLGAHAQPAHHFHRTAAELLQPACIQRIHLRTQARALLDQTLAQDFVSAAGSDGLVYGGGVGGFGHGQCS